MRLGVPVDDLGIGLKRGVEFAAQLGLDCVELACSPTSLGGEFDPRDFSASARRDFRNFLARKGVSVAAVRAKLTAPLTIHEANNRNVPELAACFEVARGLGAGIVTVSLGPLPSEKRARDPRREAAAEALSDLTNAATRHGIRFALRAGTEPAETLAEFLEETDLPFVGVAMDPGEFALREQEVPSAVERLARWICHSYARDAKAHEGETRLGRGDVPWPEYLAALSGIDCAGALVIVPPAGGGVLEAAARSADFLRSF